METNMDINFTCSMSLAVSSSKIVTVNDWLSLIFYRGLCLAQQQNTLALFITVYLI